jgi:hypothetical protein
MVQDEANMLLYAASECREPINPPLTKINIPEDTNPHMHAL